MPPAVGLACELPTVGGELGPDSGLLLESGKRSVRERRRGHRGVCLPRAACEIDIEIAIAIKIEIRTGERSLVPYGKIRIPLRDSSPRVPLPSIASFRQEADTEIGVTEARSERDRNARRARQSRSKC